MKQFTLEKLHRELGQKLGRLCEMTLLVHVSVQIFEPARLDGHPLLTGNHFHVK